MTTRIAYLFDEETGEYRGIYEAHESPMEPGVFHTPVHSTLNPPPVTGANEAAVFSAGEWAVIPDYRGKMLYDQVSGDAIEHHALGEIPAGFGVEPSPATQRKMAEAATCADRDARIASVEWRYARHARELRLGIPTSDDLASLDKYIQALADVPTQPGFPGEIDWPVL